MKRAQLDLYRDSAHEVARAHRLAAETARLNPFETPDDAERRARYYETLAEQIERQVRA